MKNAESANPRFVFISIRKAGNLRETIKEGRNEYMVNIGDHIKCPECSRTARVVWVSKDGKTAGVQCPATHSQMSRPDSRLGSTARSRSKTDRNMIFLMEINEKNSR